MARVNEQELTLHQWALEDIRFELEEIQAYNNILGEDNYYSKRIAKRLGMMLREFRRKYYYIPMIINGKLYNQKTK